MATFTSHTRVKGGDEQPRKQTSAPTPDASWVLRIDLSNVSETADDATAGQDGIRTGVFAIDLLAGDVANIERFGSVDWLEDVAHGLLDPIRRRGRLWTYKEGSREHWATAVLDPERWEEVRAGAPIESRIYEYYTPTRPDPGFLVTKMSPKSRLSRTSAGAEDHASIFRDMVEKRDLRCVISGVSQGDMPYRCVASHLIPKRLREVVPQMIHRYVEVPGLVFDGGIWDPRIGIFLEDRLDTSVDLFYMGFHRLRDDQAGHYVIHLFHDNDLYAANGHQVKHGADITFRRSIPNGQALDSAADRLEPPEGVFLWHYIQCVTLRFATPQFKALQGALHTEKPSRYHGDSDDDSDDALDNLDYPSKWLDDAWAAAEEAKMARDRLALLFNPSKDD